MLEFKRIEVLKTCDNFHYIVWEVQSDDASINQDPTFPPDPHDDPNQYYYVVYWSNDSDSGFHSIKDDDGNDVHIDGADGPLEFSIKHYRKHYNFNNKYYYVVVGYHKTEPQVAFKSKAVYFGMFADGMQIEMKYVEDTLYEMYYGEPALIIKRKPFGEPCPNCWSKERQQRTKSNCPVCQNTGKVYGYYQPIQVQMSFDSDPVKSDVQKNYEVVTDVKRGRISNYPLVRPRDLIINLDDNKRYVINHIETTKLPHRAVMDRDEVKLSKQNYVVSQLLTLQEIPADDQEYFMNYLNIPEECDDYSLPRFQTHPPASGNAPISVDDKQVVSLNYSDDFDVNEDGELVLKNPFLKTGMLDIDYLYTSGTNKTIEIPNIIQNIIPGANIISAIRRIKISIDKVGNVDSEYPATIRVAAYSAYTGSSSYQPGMGDTLVLNDFITKDEFSGIKYYVNKDIYIDDTELVTIDPNKSIYVDIIPNGSWTFDIIRVSVKIEMKVA